MYSEMNEKLKSLLFDESNQKLTILLLNSE